MRIRQEPSAWWEKPVVMETSRRALWTRPDGRMGRFCLQVRAGCLWRSGAACARVRGVKDKDWAEWLIWELSAPASWASGWPARRWSTRRRACGWWAYGTQARRLWRESARNCLPYRNLLRLRL